ncbi:MAG: nucleotide-binding protein [Acidobacteriales bacterium]|nr:nucleotide-binding protein [Terriglobales bacterium]
MPLISDPALVRMPRLFLHFFDIHFLEMKALQDVAQPVVNECRLATRLAILAANEVFIPAASYIESPICRDIIDEFRDIYEYGLIWLVGSGASAEEFRYEKLQQYRRGSPQYGQYSAHLRGVLPPFKTRHASATKDIKADWTRALEDSVRLADVIQGSNVKPSAEFERRWESVPERLGQRAFIVPYVMPLLFPRTSDPVLRYRLHSIVNESYFASFAREFMAGIVADLVYLASPHQIPTTERNLQYRTVVSRCRIAGILKAINRASAAELLALRNDARWLSCLAADETGLTHSAQEPKGTTHKMIEDTRAFIVHGHDKVAALELKDYLQNTLNMREPVILDQQPSAGMTIIEKFEVSASQTDVAFVLLTPDDVGGKTVGALTARARQNVLFELGYFVGKLGRRTGRVLLLHKGDTEIPSDLFGIVYIDITAGIGSAGERIRKELSAISG